MATDYFTKWVEEEVYSKPPTSEMTVKFIYKKIINRFRVLAYIVTDSGINFQGNDMEDLAEKYGFEHKHSASRHAPGNGQVKRSNITPVDKNKNAFMQILKKCYTYSKEIM